MVTLQSNRIEDQRAELPVLLRPDSQYIPSLVIEKIDVNHEAEEVSLLFNITLVHAGVLTGSFCSKAAYH